ncbi:titin homolog isoform X1 [Pygocentrus nattereri]|uniref:Cold shock domain-containing protein n=1 Tax=Pygocentrus nattereri TaxID=42514 RepID=A0A3B4C647_PYGNA|nr:titin homolog isoform X1 [Pygocentrus nattereri]
MAKGRKRGNARPQANGPRFRMPPPGGPPLPDELWGRPAHPGEFRGHPPHSMGLPGPRMPPERFPMGPPDFRPPCPPPREGEPYIHDEFMMRDAFMHRDFHRPAFEGDTRYLHPDFEGRPSGYHPSEFEGGPPYPHPDFEGRPPAYDRGPEHDFYPPPYKAGPTGFDPPEFRGGPPDFHPPRFEREAGYPVIDSAYGPADAYSAPDPHYPPPVEVRGDPAFGATGEYFGPPPDFMGPGPRPGLLGQDVATTAPPPPPCPPPSVQNDASQQASKQTKNENTKTTASKTTTSTVKNLSRSVKPPPGRSMGVISFIGSNYGFIEREDLKKFSFPFDAYFGKREHLVPGVKVHFTAVKELGKECATDVKVAPGGTEEIEETIYEGVVTTVLPDSYVLEPHPGRIRTIISTDPIKLPFGKTDTKATLLLFDRVKFQLLTDIISKENRATNIMPQIPETFQLTKEVRERGVVMNIKGEVCTIMAKRNENLTASVKENLSDDELNVMDEVEFTAMTVKDTVKAIRLKKLPEGSVFFDSQAKNRIAEAKEKITDPSAVKDKWKPVTSEVISEDGVSEDTNSEKYEGTIFKVITKNSKEEGMETEEQEPAQGLLDSTVAGTHKRLPFRSGDVITQATMMVGDKVRFNISINTDTKEERAVNIEIQPDSLHTDSAEQRRIGVVVKLDDNSGLIKTPQDPQLVFDLSEVLESTKLTLSEKVEFTLAVNEGAEGGKRAIRIRRLTESVFTSVPKLDSLGEKEKKKMTIKLLRGPKEQINNGVKKEVKNGDLAAARRPEKGKSEASKAVKPTKSQKQDIKGKQEKGKTEREHSRENSRRRYSRSRSRSHDRSGSYYRRQRSSSREKCYSRHRRSRSHSRDRTHRYKPSHSHSHSRSRSRERSGRSGKKRSRSPEHRNDSRRGRSNSKERSSKRRSKSPDKKTESQKSSSKSLPSSSGYMDPSSEVVDDEIAQKRKELLELNELIARKRAIIAMEQNTKSFKDVLEMDRKHGFATFDYQHKTCLESAWMPDMKPAKSILKKHSDPLTLSQHQASKRSLSPEEPEGYPRNSTTSPFACSTPTWVNQSSSPETTDQELARKKRQLEELSESIARKRAIVAMEQKAKTISDEPDIKKEYDFASRSDNLDISAPSKDTWRLDIKPDPQPKKSILKKRSEILPDQLQSDMTSTDTPPYSHTIFPSSNPPQNDYSAFSKPSGSSHTVPEKSINPPNTVDIFKRLISEVSTSACRSESSPFNNPPGLRSSSSMSNSGSFYGQKNTGEAKAGCSYEDTSSASHSQSHQARDKSSISDGPTVQPSGSEQKRNLATQMQRFLSALNKADSNLLSSLLREARKDSNSLGQTNSQVRSGRKVPHKDEMYDPFKETEDNEDNPFLLGSRQSRISTIGQVENCLEDHGDDDLLPHERAVQDGSGFSRIVGMKYGTEAKAENRFLYEEKKAPESQSRFSEEQKQFSEHDRYDQHKNRYSDFEQQGHSAEGYQNPYLNTQELRTDNRERYERQKVSERYRVGGSHSPVHQTSENTSEDTAKKTEHYEKLQNLLQTIGLKLDTAEVSKLADRTRERLYGKKVKPQSASSHSFDQKDEQSVSRYNRRGSRADSSDSEGVRSVSPKKSSSREVYMTYMDSLRSRDQHDEVSGIKERDLVSLKRTIKNSPEATPDSNHLAPSTAKVHDSYKPTTELTSTSAQSVSFFYTQKATESSLDTPYIKSRQNSWESSYHLDEDKKGNSQDLVSPYSSVPQSPLHYTAGINIPLPSIPPPSVPPGFGTYTAPLFPVPPPFSTPNPFGPPPAPVYPPPPGQFNMPLQTGGSGYGISQVKIKPTAPTRCLKTIETVKTQEPVSTKPALANVRPALISIQPVEETQPKDSQGEDESKQAAPVMEDDIKAKQKKRLEQFNQRMRLKKEQQMEAQRTHGQSQKSAPGKVTRNEVKNVWICGHSLVFWAEKRATSPEFGMQLGMDPNCVRIWWKGVQGMTWQQLLPQLLQLKDNWPKPDVILLHLGGNDIGKSTTEAFLAAVKKDLISMKSIFPECLLVWSNILPRRSWRHSEDSAAVDNTRRAINKSICGIITELSGSSLTHENIKPGLDTGLYRPDGVHLSGKGIDTFNLNMQDFLEKWESEINKDEPSEI